VDWLNWIRGILVVALFGWLLEALQPASELRRYTRLAIGLLLMVAILQPAVTLLSGRLPTLSGTFWKDPDVRDILQQGVFLQKNEESQAVSMYRGELQRAAESTAEAVSGAKSVTVQVALSGQRAPEGASVRIRAPAQGAQQTDAVQAAVASTLGIAQRTVHVEWSGGGVEP